MKQNIVLNELQVEEIRKLAEKERQTLGFIGEVPIGEAIFRALDTLGIILLEYPIDSEGDRQAFSASLLYSEVDGNELVFLGLNTADYLDKQIFAVAHELYHYFTKSGSHLSRLNGDGDLIEAMANRFAAEFLLPQSILKSIVLKGFKRSCLQDIRLKTLLRFIARLQCAWWIPYRSLVRALREIDAIDSEQYDLLYTIEERDSSGEYWKYGEAINGDIFLKLNTVTLDIGTSPENIELIIRNFEDDLIDEHLFVETLNLFRKRPEDFGYFHEIASDDLAEFDEWGNGG
jgi:Zn-dependent peptidase ImmA (M78 family)